MKRSFRRRAVSRPAREWVSLEVPWEFLLISVTQATELLQLQAPTTLNLTADPPEPLTVLRIVGDFSVGLSAANSTWVLALLVQDTPWSPGAVFSLDADKRILWSRTYVSGNSASAWDPPGQLVTTTTELQAPREAVHLDIAPKVKVEAGKALYLVAYEEGGAASFSTTTRNLRLLYQRSGRR